MESPKRTVVKLPSVVTPTMLSAAWQTWHERHGGKLGPGPAFVEAVNAALLDALKHGTGAFMLTADGELKAVPVAVELEGGGER